MEENTLKLSATIHTKTLGDRYIAIIGIDRAKLVLHTDIKDIVNDIESISFSVILDENKYYLFKRRNVRVFCGQHEKYYLKLDNLTDLETEFLEKYFESSPKSNLHRSNIEPKEFEIGFAISTNKVINATKRYKFIDIFRNIIVKMNYGDTIFAKLPLTHIYFGNEFCSEKIPTVSEIKRMANKAINENLQFIYVTPLLYEEDIDKYRLRLKTLDEMASDVNRVFEVVFNNWGMLQMILDYKHLKPILGRNIIKMKRDPRFLYDGSEFNHNQQLLIGELDIKSYRKLLSSKNINVIEVDPLPQGIQKDLHKDFNYTMHFPYYVIACSRMCLLGFLSRDPSTIFDFKKKCSHECEQYYYKARISEGSSNTNLNATNNELRVKGRALLGKSKNWRSDFDFDNAYEMNIKRIIFHMDHPN